MAEMISAVGASIKGAIASGGVELYVKAALALALLALYLWGRREADKALEQEALRKSEENEKRNRDKAREENVKDNAQAAIDSALSQSEKERAKSELAKKPPSS